MTPLRERMLVELRRRNFSPDTIRGYVHAVEQFATYFDKSPELLGLEEIGDFQLHLLEEKQLAIGTIALRMGALRFLYKRVLKRRDLDFENLPVILSPEEAAHLIEAASPPAICASAFSRFVRARIFLLSCATDHSSRIPSSSHAGGQIELAVRSTPDVRPRWPMVVAIARLVLLTAGASWGTWGRRLADFPAKENLIEAAFQGMPSPVQVVVADDWC